jgi:alcohol dehydrogenase
MPTRLTGSEIVIAPTPTAHFGVGAVGKLPGISRGLGGTTVVVVTGAALAFTPVVASVVGVLEANTPRLPAAAGIHAILLAC